MGFICHVCIHVSSRLRPCCKREALCAGYSDGSSNVTSWSTAAGISVFQISDLYFADGFGNVRLKFGKHHTRRGNSAASLSHYEAMVDMEGGSVGLLVSILWVSACRRQLMSWASGQSLGLTMYSCVCFLESVLGLFVLLLGVDSCGCLGITGANLVSVCTFSWKSFCACLGVTEANLVCIVHPYQTDLVAT
jgi:hypothetical protein